MSCNPPCCKREPDGRCPYCYSAQEWAMQLPPDDIIRVAEGDRYPLQPFAQNQSPDLLKDGSGDAVLGECGIGSKRNGSDGYDSHTYIGSSRDAGRVFETPRTEVGDSIPRPVLTSENIISNQIIGDKVYGITRVRPRKVFFSDGRRIVAPYSGEGVFTWGRFHVPDWVFLDKSYTKTGKFRFGLDRAGPDDLFDRPRDDEWSATLGPGNDLSSQWYSKILPFATCGFPFINASGIANLDYVHFMYLNDRLSNTSGGPFAPGTPFESTGIPVINNDDITNDRDFDGISLNDRRVFMRMRDHTIGSYWPLLWDTGLTLGDVLDSGLFLEINVVQKDGPDIPEFGNNLNLFFDVTYSIPQSGFQLTEEKESGNTRCFNGGIYLRVGSRYTRTYHNSFDGGEYDGVFISSNEFDTFDVCNGDPSWWINEINEGFVNPSSKTIAALSWIQNLEVADGDFADTSFLVVRQFRHESSVGSVKKQVSYLDYGEPSIPTGETITVGDIQSGDVMRLILDNPAEETVEVTAVTFDDPWLKTVNDTDPTLLPYTVVNLVFTLDDTVATGTVDITLTHDANNEFIPSPWVITLDAELGGGGPPE